MNPLSAAIEEGNVSKVKKLIEEIKQKEGSIDSITQQDSFGQYPAHYASVFGRKEIISLLHDENISCLLNSLFF